MSGQRGGRIRASLNTHVVAARGPHLSQSQHTLRPRTPARSRRRRWSRSSTAAAPGRRQRTSPLQCHRAARPCRAAFRCRARSRPGLCRRTLQNTGLICFFGALFISHGAGSTGLPMCGSTAGAAGSTAASFGSNPFAEKGVLEQQGAQLLAPDQSFCCTRTAGGAWSTSGIA